MREYDLYYAWQGQPVEAEFFDATDGEGWDVSTLMPQHPHGIVTEGECHVLVRPCNGGNAWWCTEEKFHEYAEPIGPGAIARETGDDPRL